MRNQNPTTPDPDWLTVYNTATFDDVIFRLIGFLANQSGNPDVDPKEVIALWEFLNLKAYPKTIPVKTFRAKKKAIQKSFRRKPRQ